MQIERIGFTSLKGARHRAHASVRLAEAGPVGDREFCLVDPARARVLRTVENPTLVQAVADWDGEALAVELSSGRFEARPETTGELLAVDYWGRTAKVETVAGPWAEAFTEHLGYEVVLARSAAPGEVVYGASVTVVTTASVAHLAERLGTPVDSARFRSTFLIDTDGEPHVEDSWVGRRLRLGEAEIVVRGIVPRCAVVDLDPGSGARSGPVLKTLAGYRRDKQEVHFGVDAVVTRPGVVRIGDRADLERG